ncbi:MAG: peroxidase-related enzyme [Chloroflexi bacterium]|nr:peroxidase-related enzyme [Chloroflexota bacterium]
MFRRFPRTAAPLLEYHDRVLRDWSPLTVAERELIAAYVSGLNSCTFCHGAHVVAARAFGIDAALFDGLMADLETSSVDARLKPILAYVGKLTRAPAMMTEGDAQAVYAAGWDEQALFDAVSVCALFNLMNRIVEGSGIKADPLEADQAEMEARIARMGGATDDPHRGERSYTRLAGLWGIADPD